VNIGFGLQKGHPPLHQLSIAIAAVTADWIDNRKSFGMVKQQSVYESVLVNAAGISESQRSLVKKLCNNGQEHLFENWEGTSPILRRQFAEQLERMDKEYADGGLEGYIRNARKLLDNSRQGINPLEGWIPSVPQGEMFELGTQEYEDTEKLGMKELGKVGFVLVAGGLGERLGFTGGIKVCSCS
jgi:UDP-N-acetylglucosamine pyrophosphorylase